MYERGKPIFLFSFVHIGPIIRIRKTIHFTIFSQWFVTFSTFIGFDTCRNEILNPLDKCFFFTEIRSYISDYRRGFPRFPVADYKVYILIGLVILQCQSLM